MQESHKQKLNPSDQVVVNVETRNSVRKQSLNKSPDLPSEEKPPNLTTATRSRTLHRLLSHSKAKACFGELNDPHPLKPARVSEDHHPESESESESEDERDATEKDGRKKHKINILANVEWAAFIVITACLVSSLTVTALRHRIHWGLELWKWCLMVLVIFGGRLVSSWLVRFGVYLIERIFMLREKVLYFVYGLQRGVQICVWMSLVLLAWTLIFDPEVEVSSRSHRLLKKVTRVLIASLVGSIIWLVKIVLVKMLASSFHVASYFDRIKESVFHQYILETLSGEPLGELSRLPSQTKSMRRSKTLPARLSMGKDGTGIDVEQLRKLSRGSSMWRMKRLMSHVMSTGLSTIPKTVDETLKDVKQKEGEISSDRDARREAKQIFQHVAKDGTEYIEEDDLLKFLKKDEVQTIFPLFQGAETGKIGKSAFKEWVVDAYHERRDLTHSLKKGEASMEQLHMLANAVFIVVIIIMSLLVTGVMTGNAITVVTSQLLVMAFIFGNTTKIMFESVVFLFMQNPFNIGDHCVIDGIEMVVEEMDVLTTKFLRFDNETINYYPNAELLTKPICNLSRSGMGDIIEFSVDVSTSSEKLSAVKDKIRCYIGSKPMHWRPNHSVVVKSVEDSAKMKIALHVFYTRNFHNSWERNNRRSELVIELKKIFDELGMINYNLPAQRIIPTQG